MRNTFVNTLVELAKKDRDIELVTGDLGFGVLKPFWEQLPDQFVNAGIAEQNMTTVAAGMALEGKTVFTYSIGNFPTLRCLEQRLRVSRRERQDRLRGRRVRLRRARNEPPGDRGYCGHARAARSCGALSRRPC